MSAPTPDVSVLLPFYNARQTLDAALHSILTQTLDSFELVAIDDGSSDGSTELVADWTRHDPRIRLLRPGRLGVVGAMNHGLAAARAPLVARMDADDLMAPDRLAAQLAYLRRHPEVDLVGTQVRLFPESALTEGFREYIRWQNACLSPEEIAADIYVELPIAHPSIMFRKQRVLAAGGYRDGPFPEDYELLLRLLHAGCRFAKLPEVLLHWRDSGTRLTRTDPRYAREAFDRLRAEYLARDPRLPRDRPLAYWGAGRKTRRRAQWLIARGFPPTVWVDIDPRKIGNRVAGAPVVAPDWLDRPERPFVLSYVANHGARHIIAGQLEDLGYRRGEDYLMVG